MTAPYTHFVGIDVAKRSLACALACDLHTRPYRLQTTNDPAGFHALVHWLQRQQAPTEAQPEACVIVMENTGLYHQALAEYLTQAGYRCVVEKTTILEKVGPEHHRKDDPFDAALILEYALRYRDQLIPYQALNPTIEQIRLLYRERRRLVKERTRIQQVAQQQAQHVIQVALLSGLWHERLALIKAQIQRLEAAIGALITGDAELRRRYDQLQGIDGIGSKTAWLWLIFFFGQGQLDARRIASRFGFAPHGRWSGTSLKRPGRSSGHGHGEMRKLLTLCARSAATHHGKYRQYKARKLAEGKAPKVVTNNLICKLIRVICAVWNQNGVYDRQHRSTWLALTN